MLSRLTTSLSRIGRLGGSTPITLDPASREKRLMDLTFQRNSASRYTTVIENLGNNFNYEADRHSQWLPENCSVLYGSPLWDQASESQRLALGHIYWCCFYNMVAGAETSAMVWNEVAAGAFWGHNGLETFCHELDMESSQERYHVKAFEQVVSGTEKALFGERLFGRRRPHYTRAAVAHPQSLDEVSSGSRIPGNLLTLAIGNSPFVATQYFAGRGLRNMSGKVKEGRYLQHAQELKREGVALPTPTAICENHFYDETFHTSTSQIISHELVRAVGKPATWERTVANFIVLGTQVPDQTLSAAVPGMFREDELYIPFIYRMLRSRLFSMDREQALDMMERSLCQEHQGFHVALSCMERVQEEGMKFLNDLDYLWPVNRDLKVMKRASIQKALSTNRESLDRFVQGIKTHGEPDAIIGGNGIYDALPGTAEVRTEEGLA